MYSNNDQYNENEARNFN